RNATSLSTQSYSLRVSCDAGSQRRIEVAFEAASYHCLTTQPLRQVRVLHRNRRNARERHEEVQVRLLEEVRRAPVVNVKQPQHVTAVAKQRRTHHPLDCLQHYGVAAKPLVPRPVLAQYRTALRHGVLHYGRRHRSLL